MTFDAFPRIHIRQATLNDADTLADIGRITFIDSHGHSAGREDIDEYVSAKYSREAVKAELMNPEFLYHLLISEQGDAIGYSKIILNHTHPEIAWRNITKLERLYLLSSFHGQDFGHTLFEFNLEFSKASAQQGMWLYVWIENARAIRFYTKMGFRCIGGYDFRISARHTNPNHLMWLKY